MMNPNQAEGYRKRQWLGKSLHRCILVTLFCLMISVLPGNSLGASSSVPLTFECTTVEPRTQVVSRIVDDRNMVFFPGYWDMTHIRVTYENVEDVVIGNLAVQSGDVVDLSRMLDKKMQLSRNQKKKVGEITFYQGSHLPALQISVDADELKKVLKDKHLIIPEGQILITEADGSIAYEGGLTQFKGRGNATYSSQYAKKPFQIKLEKKADISGMGKGKTWLLIANYLDISLLRNQINLDMAREIGVKGAVENVQADVWINGEYYGLYLLTEKIQIQKNRLDITNLEEKNEALNDQPQDSYPTFKETDKKTGVEIRGYELPADPEDITGGYILELDKKHRFNNSSANGFVTSTNLAFRIKEPTCASRAQVTYLANLFDQLWRAVKAKDGIDPETGVYYADMIDLESFAMKFLMEDFAKNFDAMAGSQYFYKDSDAVDGRIYAAPCWDYDLCMGNINTKGIGGGLSPQNTWVAKLKNEAVNWYAMLNRHEDFQEEVRRVYWEKFRPALAVLIGENGAEGEIIRSLEDYQAAIADSAVMNFIRYRPQNVKGIYAKSGKTNETATNYLFRWIRKRVASMDEENAR